MPKLLVTNGMLLVVDYDPWLWLIRKIRMLKATLENVHSLRHRSSSSGSNFESKNKVHYGMFWTTSFPDLDFDANHL